MPRIWLDYLEFLSGLGLITRTRRAFDNALRALPITQHSRIWPLYIRVGGCLCMSCDCYVLYLPPCVCITVCIIMDHCTMLLCSFSLSFSFEWLIISTPSSSIPHIFSLLPPVTQFLRSRDVPETAVRVFRRWLKVHQSSDSILSWNRR
jgi:hypothetical protein